MLLLKNEMNSKELDLLMDIYEESITYMFPDCKNQKEGLQKVKKGFTEYIKNEFFHNPENAYCIWAEDNQWVSTLRLYKLQNCYFIEALETKLLYRRKGYG